MCVSQGPLVCVPDSATQGVTVLSSAGSWRECRARKRQISVPRSTSLLAHRHIRAVIPRRRDQRPDDGRHRPLDRETYRSRNRIERLVNRLKQWRRVATRYEKRAVHFLGFLTFGSVLLRC